MPQVRPLLTRRRVKRLVHATAWVGIWVALSLLFAIAVFLQSSRSIVLASHDAVLRPTLDGWVEVRTGPVLPDVRLPSGARIGVDVYLGKTEAASTEALIERYAVIASQPEGQRGQGVPALRTWWSARCSAARRSGWCRSACGSCWAGGDGASWRTGCATRSSRALVCIVVAAILVSGSRGPPATLSSPTRQDWQSAGRLARARVPLPAEVEGARGPRRRDDRPDPAAGRERRRHLRQEPGVLPATAAERGRLLALREPEEDDTVVAPGRRPARQHRHGPVARAIADRAGATAVFDAGDDTSTGAEWEAFSLDSVDEAFEDLDRYGRRRQPRQRRLRDVVPLRPGLDDARRRARRRPGRHRAARRRRPAVQRARQLARRDRAVLHRGRRAAGRRRLRDPERRVATLLVHDANLGREALERGCADLVVGGHLHVPNGPEQFLGPDGRSATPTRPARPAGRRTPSRWAASRGARPTSRCSPTATAGPLGLQGVTLQTDGVFVVGEFVELDFGDGRLRSPTRPTSVRRAKALRHASRSSEGLIAGAEVSTSSGFFSSTLSM